MKPIIGISCGIQNIKYYQNCQEKDTCWILPTHYVKAVISAGGIPIILPYVREKEEIIYAINGLIISGGGDISPEVYCKERHLKTYDCNIERDTFEIDLVKLAIEYNIPTLAICRGMQILNVTLGGTLNQHIPEQMPSTVCHWQKDSEQSGTHQIDILSDKLAKAMHVNPGESVKVNSFHHQSVARIGSNLTVAAKSKDGIIEGLENEHHDWMLGVQWHPELIGNGNTTQKHLFETLIEQASQQK
ncbi:gamma-glutamyl-gamma-aminobutyrate hydrolase family protein [Metallumcola ferriviriculae]|uniref:Gamma-glutamyl-gamma-aminobutyrate hydrolase family protein n=1 Tax=Metallumcola ferriviriculae TaxID=3039180 RepID=A0AAU0UMC2_9FIRM|nr:gamma-glutamyl-gamma-aminobutyrate hydrolase family protein [Desulfitibacteraceae bacterium MK1]